MSTEEFWTRHVFVLLSSDSRYRGVHGQLVDRLRKEGFPPVAARAVPADPELIDDLYADLIAGQWQTWRYRLVDAAFQLGPAFALVCRYEGAGADPHLLLAERKGNQHPHLARPGTIRRDFRAVNSIVGLMHTSDGPAESEREAAVFGLTAADAHADPAGAAPAVDHLCRLHQPDRPEHRDFDLVLASVRTRVVAALWEELPGPARARVQARFPEPVSLGATGAGERLAGLLDGAVPPETGELLRCEFTPQWRGRTRMGRVERALRRAGVQLDDWERIVLESSLHFPPRRSSEVPVG